jgi:hypothetical protein
MEYQKGKQKGMQELLQRKKNLLSEIKEINRKLRSIPYRGYGYINKIEYDTDDATYELNLVITDLTTLGNIYELMSGKCEFSIKGIEE